MDNLMARLRRMGRLVLIGILVIICVALGILYMQQGAKQRELEEQITKLSLTVAKPMPGAEKLQEEYEEVNRSLSPLTLKSALNLIISIAEESGIDVTPESGKLRIPPQDSVREEKVGEGNYQVLSFTNVTAQGDHDSVAAFISNLESGETLVLKRLLTNRLGPSQEENTRSAEYQTVSSAIFDMMLDNNIVEIPSPINYAGGTAVNLMGDDPDTEDTIEGFPNITATAADKGADAAFLTAAGATEALGYRLYGNQLITDVFSDGTYDVDDGDAVSIVNYVTTLETEYYYTCEADGTIRQFDGPDVATATEYLDAGVAKTETVATITIDIYTKAGGESS